ncbi:hypothetical protein PGT21_002235 [Puccinia graminis f. sp. tritici]|uniref:Uncharacterized protein n=1 Tax=Puccinia graminis f. sp. tritici TaxID=56615 RepID=A0A5B0PF74_PUCGR|nr:hypothetical protein PGT21_002235 [Puccinia graminis f. sp. tritici]
MQEDELPISDLWEEPQPEPIQEDELISTSDHREEQQSDIPDPDIIRDTDSVSRETAPQHSVPQLPTLIPSPIRPQHHQVRVPSLVGPTRRANAVNNILTNTPFYEAIFAMAVSTSNDPIPVPKTYSAAMASPESDDWRAAIKSELDAMARLGVWKLFQLPQVALS